MEERTKIIKIPIYNQDLKVTITPDFLGWFDRSPLEFEKMDATEAVTFTDGKHYCIVFDSKRLKVGTVAHEVTHVVHWLFKDLGTIADFNNDEAEAYLNGFLFEKTFEFLFGKLKTNS